MASENNLIIGDGNTVKIGSAGNSISGSGNVCGYNVTNGLIIGAANTIGSTTDNAASPNNGAVVFGVNGTALRYGETVLNSGGATAGAAQCSIVMLVKTIPNGTTAYQECFIQGQATNLGRIMLGLNSATGFRIRASAFVQNWGGWYMEVAGAIGIDDAVGKTVMVGTNATKALRTVSGKTDDWRVRATADATNGALKIEVKTQTGAGGAAVDFVVCVELFQSKA